MAVIKDEEAKCLTHKELVRITATWLKNNYRSMLKYPIVIAELKTANTETPDVIGFRYGNSILVECKVSRADFLADKKKWFRQQPSKGMGDERYFIAPKGIIKPEELPENWGLFEIYDSGQIREAVKAKKIQEVNKRAEIVMLQSVIRRLEISTAVFIHTESEAEREEAPDA